MPPVSHLNLYNTPPLRFLTSPQRGFTNPAPKTESAREAVKSFYCTLLPPLPPTYPAPQAPAHLSLGELCSKGYARMNEYEAHLSSYDHSHKQRLKDMRQLTRDPMASSKARKAEAKANSQSGLISIKLGGDAQSSGGNGGFKRGGFKKAGFKSAFAPVGIETSTAEEKDETSQGNSPGARVLEEGSGDVESDTEDEGYEMYDPRHPTD